MSPDPAPPAPRPGRAPAGDAGEGPRASAADPSAPFVRFEGLGRAFSRSGRRVQALEDVDVALTGAQVVGLVGSNGAGKTTLLGTLTGLVTPDRGRVRLLGRELRAPAPWVGRELGLASAEDRSFEPRLDGRAVLHLHGALLGLGRGEVEAALRALDEELGLGDALERRTQDLSTGQRARLNVARALLGEPRVVLLDEATRSLDGASTQRVVEAMARRARAGALVVWSSHELGLVESFSDRLLVLEAGRVVAFGTPDELLGSPHEDLLLTFRDEGARAQALADGLRPRTPPLPREPRVRVAVEDAGPLEGLLADPERGLVRVERRRGITLAEFVAGRRDRLADGGAPPPVRAPDPDPAPAAPSPRPPHAGRLLGNLRALRGIVRRDRDVHLSHRLKLATQALVVVVWAVLLHYMGQLMGDASAGASGALRGDPVGFLLLGLTVLQVSQSAMIRMGVHLREEQLRGTLEPALHTGRASAVVVLGSLLWPLTVTVGLMSLMLAGASAFLDFELHAAGLLPAVLALGLGVASFASLGLISAGFVLVFKRGDPVALGVNLLSLLVAGAYFPRELLPAGVRAVSLVLPHTHLLEAVRAALLDGATWGDAAYAGPSLRLGLCAAVLVPSALLAWRAADRAARRRGDLART